jgi:hypothetical protein
LQYINRILKKIFISALVLAVFTVKAQTGENVYPFMNIPVSARQAALGGDAVSVRDYDVNFAAVNPALLNAEMHKKISVNAATYLAGSKYGTINYGHAFEKGHLITANVRYMDYGRMPRTDEAGFENGEFGAYDAAIGGGYAYQFEDEWTIGAQVNLINAKIDSYTSMAVAGNFGVSYHFKKTNETIGLVARNFGYQFKSFNGERENLPFRVDLGYTKVLKNFPAAVTVTAHDLQQLDISSDYDSNGQEVKLTRKVLDHFSFGAEIFPESVFNIRLGYNVKRGNELAVVDQRSFAGLSAGFGVKFNAIRIDYSHVRYHNAGNMNMLGISLDMTGNRY